MGILDNIFRRRLASETRLLTAREMEAKKLKQIMRAVGARQIKDPTTVFKLRHLSGLKFPGGSMVPARIPVSLTKGSLRDIDPWWHEEPVRRHYREDELTADRRVGNTDKYLVKIETRDIVLLDGRKIKTIRNVYYDKKKRLHSKDLLAEDESGEVFAYNLIPKNLMSLDGLEDVSIQPDKDILVVEGYPAAESLRNKGFEAVGIISGTFHIPSERALGPLLNAKNIMLWPDNDSAGATLMNGVAKALHSMGAQEGQIKLVFWQEGPRKGDAYDFSGSDDELQKLLDEAEEWSPELRFATNSIQYLSVPRTSPNLRLDYRVRQPTPELVRNITPSGVETLIEDVIRKLVNGESLSEEEKNLFESLESNFSGNEV